ncbi:MAG TPA: plasmid pRiA4b ORF-3 family protein [Candidatus Lustribacter sp.]|nr:plasmid pRiA4b ORF-3 family protein [Candidatus Lustribacter sp.]
MPRSKPPPKKRPRPQPPAADGNALAIFGELTGLGSAPTQAQIAQFLAQGGFLGMALERLRPKPLTVPAPPKQLASYRVRVDLKGAKPPVWRRLDLAGDLRLDQVNTVLQEAIGWYDLHLHSFRRWTDDVSLHFLTAYDIEEEGEGEGEEGLAEADVRLDQVLREVGDRLAYAYEFGDGWQLAIRLEAIRGRAADEPRARCVGGRRAGPPEDFGGIDWFNEMVADWGDPRGRSRPGWLAQEDVPDWFDPKDFDPDELDERLRDLFQ